MRPSSFNFTPFVCFMPGKCGAPSFSRWFSELMVGIHTIFAPILMAVSTAKGLNPPTGLFRAIPPYISMASPITSRTMGMRPDVSPWWTLNTTPRMPTDAAPRAHSMWSQTRGNRLGDAWMWVSIAP